FLAKSGLFLVIWACDDYRFMGNVDRTPELARTSNFLHSFWNIRGANGDLFWAYKLSSIPRYLLDCVCSRLTGAMEEIIFGRKGPQWLASALAGCCGMFCWTWLISTGGTSTVQRATSSEIIYMRIALFIECSRADHGGAFEQALSTIECLTRQCATKHDFVIFTPLDKTCR